MRAEIVSAAKPRLSTQPGHVIDASIARARKRGEEGKPRVIEQSASLTPWPEPVRAVPNAFLRSALFRAIRKKERPYVKHEQLIGTEGIEIFYSGERLDQTDLDVWQGVVHAARGQELGSKCRITSYALLKILGKTDSGKNRESLHEQIRRLRAATIELKHGRYVYIGGLVGEACKDNETKEWLIELNPKLSTLFGSDQFTLLEWCVRRALNKKPLALWLHGFYSSHARPFPIKMETLLKLSGSESEHPRSAQQKLRKALDAVSKACLAKGEGFSYDIRDDLVRVEKTGSRTQRRHLAKKTGSALTKK